ncbi:S8 family serine peptidase [Aeribacillus sp. FSL K6-1305]|uniref:S8 family peptidase n=1 Tax=Aeribacillus sp. FSL K6-1305 TaxID=2954569 RepID=UPI0030FD8FEA
MIKNIKNLLLLFLVLFIIILTIILVRNNSIDIVGNEVTTIKKQKIDNWAINLVGSNSTMDADPIKIAILDSGINKTHKEFEGLSFKEYNAITPGDNIKDEFGHGTAVAGIIAAKGIEVTGILDNVILYDVKVLDEKGRGKVEDVVKGIEWSIEQEVDIINISFGFSSDKVELKSVINKAIEQGIIITAAAGNTLGLTIDYPAQYNDVLSISSFDENFKLDPLSGVGKVDYSAPGVEIISTDNKGSYSTFSGTSFATAYATGVIAAILNESDSNYNANTIKEKLSNYVVKLGEKEHFGEGFLTLRKEKVEEILNEKEFD